MKYHDRLALLKIQLYDGVITEEEYRRKVKEFSVPGRLAIMVASILLIFNSIRWSPVLLVPLLLRYGDLSAVPPAPIFFHIFQLFSGIFGMIYSNNLDRAKVLNVVGLLFLAVTLFFVLAVLLPSGFVFHVFYSAANLALSIIYLYGAHKNHKVKKVAAGEM